MQQEIQLKYINNTLQIGVVSWREVYLLSPTITLLYVEAYKGRLVYRKKGSSKRLSYNQIKTGLTPTTKVVVIEVPDWL